MHWIKLTNRGFGRGCVLLAFSLEGGGRGARRPVLHDRRDITTVDGVMRNKSKNITSGLTNGRIQGRGRCYCRIIGISRAPPEHPL